MERLGRDPGNMLLLGTVSPCLASIPITFTCYKTYSGLVSASAGHYSCHGKPAGPQQVGNCLLQQPACHGPLCPLRTAAHTKTTGWRRDLLRLTECAASASAARRAPQGRGIREAGPEAQDGARRAAPPARPPTARGGGLGGAERAALTIHARPGADGGAEACAAASRCCRSLATLQAEAVSVLMTES